MTTNDPISTKIFKAGDVLMEEGEKGSFVYLIINGTVNIFQDKEGEATQIAQMSSGDILGEMGILTNEPRNATAIAAEECKVVMIRDHTLHSALLNDRLPIIKPLTKQLVLRCKEAETANTKYIKKIAKLEKEIETLQEQLLQHTLSSENPL